MTRWARTLWLLLATSSVADSALAQKAVQLQASQVAARVEHHQVAMVGFRATFSEVRVSTMSHERTQASGAVVATKTGSFAWRYPDGNFVMSDGQYIATVDSTVSRVTTARIGTVRSLPWEALSFMRSGFATSYQFQLTEGPGLARQGEIALLEQPIVPDDFYVVLATDPITGFVETEKLKTYRETVYWHFTQVVEDQAIDPTELRAVVPSWVTWSGPQVGFLERR